MSDSAGGGSEGWPPAFDYFVRDEAPSFAMWSPFRSFFAGRSVALKVRRADLTSDEFYLLLDAALWVDMRALLHGEVRMCLLCVERPAELLEEIASLLIPGPVTGSWFVRLGMAGYALIVVARELPLQPGNGRTAPPHPPPARMAATARPRTPHPPRREHRHRRGRQRGAV